MQNPTISKAALFSPSDYAGRFRDFVGRHAVLWIAIAAAIVTCVLVPIDSSYLTYFDLRTLSCLFCTLAVIAAFQDIRFFEWLALRIVRCFRNARNVVLALVAITYVGSMILANDMALITFLPLGYFSLRACNQKKLLAYTFVLQNVAANLGGMLTPFGNPQNLYLFSYYGIPTGEFFSVMAPPFAIAFVLLAVLCFLVKPFPLELEDARSVTPSPARVAAYGVLFVLSILIVFRVFPYYWGLLAVTLGVGLLDVKALAKVDYGLLLTFCAFFVFSGNLARIPAVADFLSNLVSASPLFVGVACCQVISNVPSAVLLSRFTTNYRALLIAVNLGGLGTPIASLASLITLERYRKLCPGHTGRYLILYSAVNFGLLALLLAAVVPMLAFG